MAVLTTTAFISKWTARFADNTSREISEADVREFAQDIADSFSSVIGETEIQSWKDPCDVATTANITLSGEQTIDGVLTSASRVLVKNQSTTSANGIYVSGAGAWSRSTDADADAELEGAAVGVTQGTTQQNTVWLQTSDSVSLGSTAIAWQLIGFGSAGIVPVSKGGTGLTTIAARSLFVANVLDTLVALTPSAGQSIRINAGNTAWEAYTPSSGITNAAASNELMKSNGTNAVASGIFSTTAGNLDFGTGLSGSQRDVQAAGTATDISISVKAKGTGAAGIAAASGIGFYAGSSGLQIIHGNTLDINNGSGYTRIVTEDATTNTVIPPLRLRRQSSGTPATGIGTGLIFETETGASNYEIGATIESVTTDVTGGSEDFDLVFKTMAAGAAASEKLRITSGGGIVVNATNTGGGTTGNRTINNPSGTVNFAAAATTLTVTNNLVTTSSLVFCTVRTNDTTATIKNVVPGSGSFVITLGAAATAETSVGFFVIN